MLSKQTAIIVDDEQDSRENLERLIHHESPELQIISTADSAQTALKQVIEKHPDLLFIDIQMSGQDGFWLADKLRHFENSPDIIFVTAYDEYAIKSIKHAAFDFLIKPIIPENLKNILDRYQSKNNKERLSLKLEKLSSFINRKRLKLNTLNGFVIVKPEDIVYCEAEGNYSLLHLTNGRKELISMQLGLVEEKLGTNNFLRINRSTTINLNYLDSYNRKSKQVILQDIIQKYEIKASRSGAKKLMVI